MFFIKIKKYKLLTTLLLIPILLTGCGSSVTSESMSAMSDSYNYSTVTNTKNSYGVLNSGASMEDYQVSEDYFEEEYVETESVVEQNTSVKSEEEAIVQNQSTRKLIKTVNLSMQTKQFDTFVNSIEGIINNYGGYIESSNIDGKNYYNSYRNRYADYSIRIPSDNLSDFLTNINDLGTVSSKSENVEDVTLSYYDVQSEKEALEVEQERLMDILSNAETIEQIIALEQRLSQVRYEINSLGSQLRLLDNKVDYATVYLDLSEVEVEISPVEEKTVIDTIKENWAVNIIYIQDFFEELIINMTSNIPFMIFEVVFVVFIIFVHRKRKKKKLKKKLKEEQTKDA